MDFNKKKFFNDFMELFENKIGVYYLSLQIVLFRTYDDGRQ